MLVRRPSPFGELLSLRNTVDRIFDDSFFRQLVGPSDDTLSMPLDIYNTSDSLVIEASLPGVRPQDVDVSVLGDTLTLTATSATEREGSESGYHMREVRRGRFSRTVALPAGLRNDAAVATFENGILKLSFPKAEQARPRQIPIMPATEGTATAVTSGAPTAVQAADQGAPAEPAATDAAS
jgi:HSP20 family protein